VAHLLGLPLRKLTWWIYALSEDRRYHEFTIERRAGGAPRQIHAPIKPIKDMQRCLLGHFAPAYEPRPNVHGYLPGKSPATNAGRHQRQRVVLRVDLRDFFPSIHFGRVRGLFRGHPFNYPEDVAQLLAHICCHRGSLPLGAPTSPVISNFIARGLDSVLSALAATERVYYTRYADDLCFSTRRTAFSDRLVAFDENGRPIAAPHLSVLVSTEGFEVNHPKTRLMRYSQRQRVTGLIVNDRVNVSREYIRELRVLLHTWEVSGQAAAAASFASAHRPRNGPPGKATPAFTAVLGGRIQHVGSVKGWTSPVYRDLARRLQALDGSFAPRTLKHLPTPQEVIIYTEGETDPKHLLAAQDYFHDRDEFRNLELRTVDATACGGNSELRSMAKALAVTEQPIPCICVFDADDPSQPDPGVGPTGTRDYGKRVGAMAIRHPAWRDPNEGICIEMLYRDEDLKRPDDQGRRVYLRSEFNPRNGFHKTENVLTLNPKSKTLVREEVLDRTTGDSVGLAKTDFAAYIETKMPPFDAFEFEGFRPTFEALEELAARIS
jgi:RNA-directed DNA polymerase